MSRDQVDIAATCGHTPPHGQTCTKRQALPHTTMAILTGLESVHKSHHQTNRKIWSRVQELSSKVSVPCIGCPETRYRQTTFYCRFARKQCKNPAPPVCNVTLGINAAVLRRKLLCRQHRRYARVLAATFRQGISGGNVRTNTAGDTFSN